MRPGRSVHPLLGRGQHDLDRFYEIHYEESYSYTAQIVIVSFLLWIIIGGVFH